jgi:ABC-type Fe3+-hydroxamate transport system substrate-binding protein
MLISHDQLGNVLLFNAHPSRIVCLVPSITELLFDLGLGDKVVGITKFCVHPTHWKREKMRIGGTKNCAIDRIKSLMPDIVIANQEENERSQIEELRIFTKVWVSKVDTIASSLELIVLLGELLGVQNKAAETVTALEAIYRDFPKVTVPISFVYLIWKNPIMVAGNDTYIHHVLSNFGFTNAIQVQRYPEIDLSKYASVDCVFLSSEPYPFKEKHVQEFQSVVGSKTKVLLVDGEVFSWYGSRLLHVKENLKNLLNQF